MKDSNILSAERGRDASSCSCCAIGCSVVRKRPVVAAKPVAVRASSTTSGIVRLFLVVVVRAGIERSH